jgi:hypothetical protein
MVSLDNSVVVIVMILRFQTPCSRPHTTTNVQTILECFSHKTPKQMYGMLHVQTASPTDPVWPRSASHCEVYLKRVFTCFVVTLFMFPDSPHTLQLSSFGHIPCICCWWLVWCMWVVMVVSGWLAGISFFVMCVFLGHLYNPISLSRPSHTRSYRPLWTTFGVYIVGSGCCSFV